MNWFVQLWASLENKLEGWPNEFLSAFLIILGCLSIIVALAPSKVLKAILVTYILFP